MRDSKKRAAGILRGAGFSNREIARLLGINESTVRRTLPSAQPTYLPTVQQTVNALMPLSKFEQRFEITVRPL